MSALILFVGLVKVGGLEFFKPLIRLLGVDAVVGCEAALLLNGFEGADEGVGALCTLDWF